MDIGLAILSGIGTLIFVIAFWVGYKLSQKKKSENDK